jgi:PLD-like domain
VKIRHLKGTGGTVGGLRTFARGELLRQIASAKSTIRLASPFLSRPVAEELVNPADASTAAEKRLLTALVAGSVRIRALDPEALHLLKEAGWQIRSIRNLHAKVSLIDSDWGLVGSGNLTNAGLGSTERGNVELGVVLNSAQIELAASLYDGWLDEAETVTDVDIERFSAMPKSRGIHGAEEGIGPALAIAEASELERILGTEDPQRRYWVKANYHRRSTDGQGWWQRGWISDWRRASYRKGDLILLYLGAKYDGPRKCPVVARVIKESRYDPEFVRRFDPEAGDRWPYVTGIECVFEVPASQGVPLAAFKVTPNGLQGGHKQLSLAQFETAAQYLLSAAKAG